MAAVRPIDSSVRRGALLAGIPLFIGGLAPFDFEPLQFPWDVAAANNSVRPLLIPAAGLMITAVGLLPGLPRLVRGILMLIFVGIPIYFSFDLISGLGGREAIAFSDDLQGKLLIASIGLAAVTEMMVAWKKVSKVLAFLAVVGWLSYLAVLAMPSPEGEPLVINMIEGFMVSVGLPGVMSKILGVWSSAFPLLVAVLALVGAVFAFIRLVRSHENMLRSPFKSGWTGILMAGSVSIFLTVIMILRAISVEVHLAIVPDLAAGLILWGFSLCITVGLAHTILGLMAPPGPIPARDFSRDQKAKAVKAAAKPQPYQKPAPTPQPSPTPQPVQTPARPAAPPPQAAPGLFAPPVQQPTPQPSYSPTPQNSYPPTPQASYPPTPQASYSPRPAPAQAPLDSGPVYNTQDQVNIQQQLQEARRRSQDHQAVGGTDTGYPRHHQQEQPRHEAPAQPPQPAKPPQPRYQPPAKTTPKLEPYPGYPGYFICPNMQCRGGVAQNTSTCPHCGQTIEWG